MLESYFARPGRRVDLVVVTFYEDDLADGNAVEIGRLAQFFTSVRDWPDVFRTDLPALADREDFVVSSVWASYAASARIRERLLLALIPDFRGYSERANQIAYAHERQAPPRAAAPGPPRYAALARFLRRAAELNTRVCFVAYPTLVPNGALPYELPADLMTLLSDAGAGLIDLRRVPALRPELYADEVHLAEPGRVPYTLALGRALSTQLGRPPVVGHLGELRELR
jgi:hypothetical protein